MLIKIVDDDQVFAKKIERMVYDGFKDIFLDYSIDCITSHFEDRYFEKGDIFFLDIDLKEKNGIKIAEEIRENNSNAIIIFVSAMNDMVFDSLIVQPFYFIRKDNFDRDMKIACTLIQKYINKLFKYSPLFKEYLKKYLKTILYTFFTFIVGKTFEHLDMWVDLFFVSIWMLVDEKENINIENKKETIPSLIGIVLGLLLQYFI